MTKVKKLIVRIWSAKLLILVDSLICFWVLPTWYLIVDFSWTLKLIRNGVLLLLRWIQNELVFDFRIQLRLLKIRRHWQILALLSRIEGHLSVPISDHHLLNWCQLLVVSELEVADSFLYLLVSNLRRSNTRFAVFVLSVLQATLVIRQDLDQTSNGFDDLDHVLRIVSDLVVDQFAARNIAVVIVVLLAKVQQISLV